MTAMEISSFINGQNSITNEQSKKIIKYNPFTAEALHEVTECTLLDVVQAIQGAYKAFEEWRQSSIEDRKSLLNKIKSCLEKNQDYFAKLEALDQGLCYEIVKKYTISILIDDLNNIHSEIDQINSAQNQYFPTGVISIIGSWNLSLRNILQRTLRALSSGNAVIIKVSSASPITAEILKTILIEVGIPKGLVQILISNSSEVKELLVSHPGIHGVSFTGTLENSIQVIHQVSKVSANIFKKIQILSGSKNTAICLQKPEPQIINKVMESFLIGQGQLVWNSARLCVLEKFEKEWTDAISDYLNRLVPANCIEDNSVWSPCLKQTSFDTFSNLLKQAREDQAKLIQGSYSLNDQQMKMYLKPSFTKDMSKCSELQQHQIHSPLFILSSVKYPFDCAKNANLSYYGFAAHVFAEEDKVKKITSELAVGLVSHNDWSIAQPQLFSGVKQSAFGYIDHRIFGDFYSNVKIMT